MTNRFDSIKKGAQEAIEWTKGKKTAARVRKYSALEIAEIKEKSKNTERKF